MKFLVAIVSALVLTACAGVFIQGQVGAEGVVWAGPVTVNGIQVAPQFDVVEGKATVTVQSSPPYLTIDLEPAASPVTVFAKPLTKEQQDAIDEGRVLVRKGSVAYPVTAFPHVVD